MPMPEASLWASLDRTLQPLPPWTLRSRAGEAMGAVECMQRALPRAETWGHTRLIAELGAHTAFDTTLPEHVATRTRLRGATAAQVAAVARDVGGVGVQPRLGGIGTRIGDSVGQQGP